MKKSRIFLTTGALVLAVTAIFATKTTKKFTAFATAQVHGTGFLVVASDGNTFQMTSSVTGNQLEMKLNGTLEGGLRTKASGSTTLLYGRP
jgi:hypothetical protein